MTAVQQASQSLEVQGAPPTVQADGGDFRETFAANVSAPGVGRPVQSQGGAANDPGRTSSTSQDAGLGLLVKPAAFHQGSLLVEDHAIDEDAAKQTRDTGSASSKDSPEPVLEDAGGEALRADRDSRSAVLTPIGDETPLKPSGSATPIASPLVRSVAAEVLLKDADGNKSVDGPGSKHRRTGFPDSNKQADRVRTDTIAPGSVVEQAQGNAGAALPAPQVPLAAGISVAHEESRPDPLKSALTRSEVAGRASRSEAAAVPVPTHLEMAAPQGIGGLSRLAGEAKPAAAIVAGLGTASPAVTATATSSQTTDADSESSSELKSTETKATASSTESARRTVLEVKSVTGGPSRTVAQTLHDVQAIPLGALRSDQDLSVKVQGNEPGIALPRTTMAVAPSGGETVRDGTALPVQAQTIREAGPTSVSLPGAPAKVEGARAKDGKTKTAFDGDNNAAVSTPTPAAAAGTGTPIVSASSPVGLAGGVAGKVVTAESAAPVTLAGPHAAEATAAAGGSSTPALAARIHDALGAVADPSSSGVQVDGSHRTLLATPRTLEVGMQSGTQGWLKIRAEVGDQGGINASLAVRSIAGREALHSQIPALNAFLHSEQMTVTTTVAERGAFAGGSSGSGGLGSSDGNASNGSLLQGGAQNGGARQESSQQAVSLRASEPANSYGDPGGAGGVGESSGRSSASEESGRWLNVHA